MTTGERIWTISNGLSVARVFLIPPVVYCLLADFPGSRWLAFGILLVGIATDVLDGFLARKLHQVSELGKIIDPLADKIALGTLAVVMVVTGDVPLWFVAAVVLRDLFILAGGLYIKRRKGVITQSNWAGKLAVVILSAYLGFSMLQYEALETLRVMLMWLSVALLALSLGLYAQRLFVGRKASV
jgi:CDP-diacylglycerol--glycerol-3-phosphate 3-phosphatidyltransferase